jgi:hypothetical protein
VQLDGNTLKFVGSHPSILTHPTDLQDQVKAQEYGPGDNHSSSLDCVLIVLSGCVEGISRVRILSFQLQPQIMRHLD